MTLLMRVASGADPGVEGLNVTVPALLVMLTKPSASLARPVVW